MERRKARRTWGTGHGLSDDAPGTGRGFHIQYDKDLPRPGRERTDGHDTWSMQASVMSVILLLGSTEYYTVMHSALD